MSWDKIVKVIAAAVGAVMGLFGEWTQMHTILLVIMATDYVSGWIVAATGRSPKTEGGGLSSKVGFIGLAKKGFIMAIVLIATLLDRALGNTAMVFQGATLCYYIANEGLSVLENAGLLGVPYPPRIKAALENLREKDNGGKAERTSGPEDAEGDAP